MSCRLMKQLMPWSMILRHLDRILSLSASSISATCQPPRTHPTLGETLPAALPALRSRTFCMESTRTRLPKILILSVSMDVLATRILAFSIRFGCRQGHAQGQDPRPGLGHIMHVWTPDKPRPRPGPRHS
jgi:hypothetical protein